jgi:hypothetical protein
LTAASRYLFAVLLAILLPAMSPIFPALADSSSPILAAYYDRQMAVAGNVAYGWQGQDAPQRIHGDAVQVGVGRSTYYVLTAKGSLLKFPRAGAQAESLIDGVARFAAGRSGVLAILTSGALWWLPEDGGDKRKIAEDVLAVAVGDGANYYVTTAGKLFVKGRAHRGQYGDGRLTETDRFVQTAANVAQITAHTGHAILMTRGGDVLGTGGNIYGPVGRHGLGDKAVRWSKLAAGAKAIATGSSHSLAIMADGALIAWGADYGPDPVPVMTGVSAVAAGSSSTIAFKTDGSLWQWDRGEAPKALSLGAP